MAVEYTSTSRDGTGHTPVPLSRKAFQRGLPHRVGAIEDQIDAHDRRLDDCVCRLIAVEKRPMAGPDPILEAKIDGLIATVEQLSAQLQRIDKRSLQSRRRLAVIADQVADQLT